MPIPQNITKLDTYQMKPLLPLLGAAKANKTNLTFLHDRFLVVGSEKDGLTAKSETKSLFFRVTGTRKCHELLALIMTTVNEEDSFQPNLINKLKISCTNYARFSVNCLSATVYILGISMDPSNERKHEAAYDAACAVQDYFKAAYF
ncbi:hypothetical protein EG68_04947 [Paragonimus skrjabini miyazakii]|uniref:Uncharacterized protein n=1 Tax=Paragonimus skrjabini miyazakii TaxID=59628 RepID=A0A8S9YPT0_9TREM|nr:hypothetical protein EG68_04947 [Paragonimus skrjabini miyazakii]